MIWDRIKNWLLIAFGVLAAIATAGYYRQKAGRESDKRKASEGARKTEQAATDAAMQGQARIEEARNAKVDTDRRDHFERP